MKLCYDKVFYPFLPLYAKIKAGSGILVDKPKEEVVMAAK
jgi:hypothetical protein